MKNKNKSKNIIHIGANKTATTSFQINLFSKVKKIGYLGQHSTKNKKLKQELLNLIHQDDYHYNQNILKNKIKEIKKNNLLSFVYSDEDIILSNNLSRSAKRLKKLIPEAMVVITLRNQFTAIKSWYKSHGNKLKMVPKKYFGKLVSFNEWISYCYEFRNFYTSPNQISPFAAIDYKNIIDIFSKYFGEKKIKILVYEDFKLDPNKIYHQWSRLINIDEKKILNSIKNNKKYRKSPKNIKCVMSVKNERIIDNYFSKGNLYLSKKYNLNLKSYHYPA